MPENEYTTDTSALKEEYFFLQKVYGDFDSKSITIKTWSVSGSLVLIGAGFSEKGSDVLLLIGAFASLFFWVIEAYWKGFQLAFLKRIRDIEHYFRQPGQTFVPAIQISTEWSLDWHKKSKQRVWREVITWPTVMLPHVILFIGGLILFILARQGLLDLPGNR